MQSPVEDLDQDPFATTGQRLSHILDQIKFKEGHGRLRDFQNYLIAHRPEMFENLNYTTARWWFKDGGPSMAKIDVIISALQDDYEFHHNVSLIKTWWKLGGVYPFVGEGENALGTVYDLQQDAKKNKEKNQFIVMSLITKVTGDDFNSLSSDDLVKIKDIALRMVEEFEDPLKTNCPEEYIKAIIKSELKAKLNL